MKALCHLRIFTQESSQSLQVLLCNIGKQQTNIEYCFTEDVMDYCNGITFICNTVLKASIGLGSAKYKSNVQILRSDSGF